MRTIVEMEAPNGGWGWAIVIGTAIANMFNQSLISQFGLIFGEKLESMGHGIFGVALVMNINSMVTNFSGLITGPVLKAFSPRAVTLVGVLLSATGMILSSFATNLVHVILSYSVFTGLGLGLIMPATFMAVNSYFHTRRQQAVGLSMTGTSIGQVLMPHVVSFLLNEYGYRGTTLIVGGLCLNGVVGSLLFHPVKWHMKPVNSVEITESKSLLSKEKCVDKVNHKDRDVACSRLSPAGFGIDTISNPPPIDEGQSRNICKQIARMLDLDLLKDLVFVHITTGIGLVYSCSIAFSMLFPFFLQETLRFNRESTALCMSVLSGADIVARLTIPLCTTRLHLGNRCTFLIGAGVLALCRTFLTFQSTLEFVVLASFMCGYARAATVVNQNLTISEYVSEEQLPSALGLNMITKGFLVITFGQLFGWVRDKSGSFPTSINVQSTALLFVVLTWGIEILIRRISQKRTQGDEISEN